MVLSVADPCMTHVVREEIHTARAHEMGRPVGRNTTYKVPPMLIAIPQVLPCAGPVKPCAVAAIPANGTLEFRKVLELI